MSATPPPRPSSGRAPAAAGSAQRWLAARRRSAAAVLRLLREERRSPVRLAAPDLLLHGYLSERRWLYPTRPSRSAGYVADTTYWRLAPTINPRAVRDLFQDKAVFDGEVRARGLGAAVPQLLATVVDGRVTVHQEWTGPVALKLADGAAGKGFALHPSLAEALARTPATGSHLVQEQVVAHPYGVELFPGSLNTLRVLALREVAGAPVRIAAVVHKVGRTSSAPLDAVSRGGLVAAVDPVTGRLGPGVGQVLHRRRDTWDVHPDSGARITGRVVPALGEVLGLVTAAMEAFPEALHVGWDVAVSTRGPLIIEGNARMPSVRLLQTHGPFAAHPSVRPAYERRGLLPHARR